MSTRARLERAALALFDEHGYDDVTVAQIAEAVGVSRRTFFRHFPTKLDALLADAEARTGAFVARLYRRPELSMQEALIAAIANEEADESTSELDLVRARVIRGTASLAGAVQSYESGLEGQLAEWIGQRTARPPTDFHVRVAAAALVAARRVVVAEWLDSGGEVSVTELARASLTKSIVCLDQW